MPSLGKELHQTIRNLEQIRQAQDPPQEDVLALLDLLYARQIDLIDAAIQNTTDEYLKATAAMQEAAARTGEAVEDLAKLEAAIQKVAVALNKVKKLLAAVA